MTTSTNEFELIQQFYGFKIKAALIAVIVIIIIIIAIVLFSGKDETNSNIEDLEDETNTNNITLTNSEILFIAQSLFGAVNDRWFDDNDTIYTQLRRLKSKEDYFAVYNKYYELYNEYLNERLISDLKDSPLQTVRAILNEIGIII